MTHSNNDSKFDLQRKELSEDEMREVQGGGWGEALCASSFLVCGTALVTAYVYRKVTE